MVLETNCRFLDVGSTSKIVKRTGNLSGAIYVFYSSKLGFWGEERVIEDYTYVYQSFGIQLK